MTMESNHMRSPGEGRSVNEKSFAVHAFIKKLVQRCRWMSRFQFAHSLIISIYLKSRLNLQGLFVSSCLWKGKANKLDGCQSTGAKHPWYSMAPGNKFDLASVICKSVRQMWLCVIRSLGMRAHLKVVIWSGEIRIVHDL